MNKDNKIISFEKRKKAEYKLKAKISIHILRKDEKYFINWYSPDEKLSEEDMYLIQKFVLSDLAKEISEVKLKARDYYEVEFEILYYENSRKSFTYICLPQNMEKEKIAEYLLISTNVYELKKSGAL